MVSEQNAKGQKNAQYKASEKLDELWPKICDAYEMSDEQDFSIDAQKLLEFIESQAGTRKNAREYFGSTLQGEIDAVTTNMEEAMMNLYNEKYGATFSLDTDRARKNGRYDKVSQFEEHKYFAGITGKMNEQNPTGYTKVGEIKEGSIYTRIGLPAGTTFFDNSKILKELNKKHDPLPVEYLKQVPRILAHPTVIVEADKANTVSVFGEIRMESGAPVLVGIMAVKDGSGRNVITKVRTVHPRLSDLGNIITDSSVLYITEDKKKAKDWFQTSRIEMPLSGTKFGFIRSIALSDDLVNKFSLDTDYMRLAEKQKAGTLTKEDESKLRKMVDDAARASMPNTKIVGEDGNPLVVYHGTSEQFTVFDKTKGRANMDIQGMFFSPWEIEAGGYGENVGKYYLNITNPADEATAYRALNMFKGQNNAGVKAREYLERHGYDGVDNEYDEFIAFNAEQIKSADLVTYDDAGNIIPLSERFNLQRDDIRYSLGTDAIRQAFTVIDTEGIEDGLEALKDVKHVGTFALKDISRMLDASAGKNKDLRNTLHRAIEATHSEATGMGTMRK